MRFIFISSMAGSPWGGSEELWSQTATRLQETGHEVMASVEYWPQLSPRIPALAEKGIKLCVRRPPRNSVKEKAWNKVKQIFKTENEYFRWLRNQNPDLVVLSQGGISDGFGWLKFCREASLPFVVISQCNAEMLWPADSVATEMSDSFSAARKLFFVSRANLELLERQLGRILPNAVIVRNPFNVSPDKPVDWPADNGVWRLACVARLDPSAKGQDLLFQVLAQPCWRDRAIEVNIYGAGPYEQGLRRLAEYLQLNSIHFHGHINDVTAIWTQNHLLVLPSRSEGLPLALVEAMWCGRPAIVTDIAGNGELSIDRETGFVAPAPTVGMLAQAMEAAWEARKEWHRMGRAARSRVEQIIPKDPVADFYKQLITIASALKKGNTNENN
jgi:glycosyltransferase involved in cell wall biosynthesis